MLLQVCVTVRDQKQVSCSFHLSFPPLRCGDHAVSDGLQRLRETAAVVSRRVGMLTCQKEARAALLVHPLPPTADALRPPTSETGFLRSIPQ